MHEDNDKLNSLKKQFHEDMIGIYKKTVKLGYTPTRFIQMVSEHGGNEAAHILIHKENVSEGFVKLWEMRRLDLSMEYHVLKPEYEDLFSEEEREICRRRLEEYGMTL